MKIQENVQIVKDVFAALSAADRQRAQALTAKDIKWIIPGEGWPLAGTPRGHQGLADLLRNSSEVLLETSFPQPPEFVSQGSGAGRRFFQGERQSRE